MSVTTLTMQAGNNQPVPPGAYLANFTGADPVEPDPLRGYGPGIRWCFDIVSAPHTGRRVYRTTGTACMPTNGCGRMLAGLVGRMPAPGENTDFGPCIGQQYLVTVEATSTGKSRVASVNLPPK